MLKLTSINDLQRLIRKSESFDEKEKQVLCKLVPIMRTEDLDRIFTVLTMEAAVVKSLPTIIGGIKTNLVNMHDKTVEGYNIFQSKMIKKAEKEMDEKVLKKTEKLIDEL